MLAVLAETLLHLRGELARRRENQNAHAVQWLSIVSDERRRDQVVNDGKGEAGSLAGSGLCQPNQIPAGECQRDGLLLYRCGMGVACVTDRVQHIGREVELRKGDSSLGLLVAHLPEIYPGQQRQQRLIHFFRRFFRHDVASVPHRGDHYCRY